MLGRVGQPFWQEEDVDRLVRGATEFGLIRRYLELNPVKKAGLVAHPWEFRWSSAFGHECGPKDARRPGYVPLFPRMKELLKWKKGHGGRTAMPLFWFCARN